MVEKEIGMGSVIEVDAGIVELGTVKTSTAKLGTAKSVTAEFDAVRVEVLCGGELGRGTVGSLVMVGDKGDWTTTKDQKLMMMMKWKTQNWWKEWWKREIWTH